MCNVARMCLLSSPPSLWDGIHVGSDPVMDSSAPPKHVALLARPKSVDTRRMAGKRCCLIRKLHPNSVTACIEIHPPTFHDHAFVISCVANLIIVLRSFISNLLRSRDMEGNAGGGGIDDICSGGAVVLLPSPRSRSPPLFQLCHLCRLNTACASGPSPLAASTSEHICRAALLNERTNPLAVSSDL